MFHVRPWTSPAIAKEGFGVRCRRTGWSKKISLTFCKRVIISEFLIQTFLEYLLFMLVLLFGGGLTANKRLIISSILNLEESLLVLLRPKVSLANGLDENEDENVPEWLKGGGVYEFECVIGFPRPSSNKEGWWNSDGREPTESIKLPLPENESEPNTFSNGGGEIKCLWVESSLMLLLPGIVIGFCGKGLVFFDSIILLGLYEISFLDLSFSLEEPIFNIY